MPEINADDAEPAQSAATTTLSDGIAPDAATPIPSAPAVPAGRGRRRVRSRWLFGGAALLGIIGGAAIGYQVQAGRKPAPLPPITPPAPHYGAHLAAGVSLPRSPDDDGAKREGDLLALVMPQPQGTSLPSHSSYAVWVSITALANTRAVPGRWFDVLLENRFRRAVAARWIDDGDTCELQLIQYHPGSSDGASQELGTDANIAGSSVISSAEPDARQFEFPQRQGMFDAGVSGRRGDVYVNLQCFGPAQIAPSDLAPLLARQLDRL
jgi:hypothetical protein